MPNVSEERLRKLCLNSAKYICLENNGVDNSEAYENIDWNEVIEYAEAEYQESVEEIPVIRHGGQ